MIIVPDSNSEDMKSQSQSPSSQRTTSTVPGQFSNAESDEMNDPPPSYASIASPQTEASSSMSSESELPPIPASNFTKIAMLNGAIKGKYAVDPSISVPTSMLPPLSCGENEKDRKNLLLQTNNGAIDVEIYVVNSGYDVRDGMKKKRTLISAATRNGAVKVKLHERRNLTSDQSQSQSQSQPQRPPIVLTCQSLNGAMEVRLPRSFRGPLKLRTSNGSVKFSDAIKPSVTTFSQIGREHKCFLGEGDYEQLDLGWEGDELDVESMNGTIKVFYNDEIAVVQPKSQGFFGRLFS